MDPEATMPRDAASRRVIGLGNPVRGDDALGHAVVSRLRERAPEVEAMAWEGDVLGLLEEWHAESVVVLVDAVLSGAPPGTLHRVDGTTLVWPERLAWRSTHALDLSLVIGLARILRRLPRQLVLVGIEAGPQCDDVPTPAAWDAIEAAVDMVLREVRPCPVP